MVDLTESRARAVKELLAAYEDLVGWLDEFAETEKPQPFVELRIRTDDGKGAGSNYDEDLKLPRDVWVAGMLQMRAHIMQRLLAFGVTLVADEEDDQPKAAAQ